MRIDTQTEAGGLASLIALGLFGALMFVLCALASGA